MDDKTLVETVGQGNYAHYWGSLEGGVGFTYLTAEEELYEDSAYWDGMPIAFPRTLKAARQILKEAGWTIVKSGEHP